MPSSSSPLARLAVVLPLRGAAPGLVHAVAALAARFPAHVDADLVVASRALAPADRRVLSALEGCPVLEHPEPAPSFGELVGLAATRLPGAVLLVLDPDDLPDEPSLGALLAGGRGPGALLDAERLAAHPVLTAAADLPSLLALRDATALPPRPRPGDPWLSASLIVKDEQAALPRCLASLVGQVDEVVVCDTGSADRTVEVARAFGARVVSAPWRGSFAAARNAALRACRGTWVLSVDADEQLEALGDVPLREGLRQATTPAFGVTIHNRESRGSGFEHDAARLFRRSEVVWQGDVHESLVDVRTGAAPAMLRAPWLRLLHDGYLQEVFTARGKTDRNLALAEQQHAEALRTRSDQRWRTAFELARALGHDGGVAPRVEALLRLALDSMPAGLGHVRSEAALRLCRLLEASERVEEAEAMGRTAVTAAPGSPQAQFTLGALLARTGRAAEAVEVLADAPPEAQRRAVAADLHARDVAVPRLRGLLLLGLGHAEQAADELSAVARRAPEEFELWTTLTEALQAAGREPLDVLLPCALTAPAAVLAGLDGQPGPALPALRAALLAAGLDPDEHDPAGVRRRQVQAVVAGHDAGTVEQAAAALEDTDPRGALQLWQQLPETSTQRVGRARCHVALDDVTAAIDALQGVEPDDLQPVDVLFVATVAGAVGDTATAQDLLRALPPLEGPLEREAVALAQRLHAAYPVG